MTTDWNTTDVFSDSSGKLRARIVAWSDGIVQMVRWYQGKSKLTAFEMPERVWLSDKHGWRKIEATVRGVVV